MTGYGTLHEFSTPTLVEFRHGSRRLLASDGTAPTSSVRSFHFLVTDGHKRSTSQWTIPINRES
jgi:hypothetical protein